MNAKPMLQQLAMRYHNHGPMRRQHDAQIILQMLDRLDDEGARIYMDNFVRKWNLLDDPSRASAQPAIKTAIRRRPMSELEQRVYQQLITPALPSSPPTRLVVEEPEPPQHSATPSCAHEA